MMSDPQENMLSADVAAYNLTDMNYVFSQGSWLTDRYNGYQQRDVVTADYGRQILKRAGARSAV